MAKSSTDNCSRILHQAVVSEEGEEAAWFIREALDSIPGVYPGSDDSLGIEAGLTALQRCEGVP